MYAPTQILQKKRCEFNEQDTRNKTTSNIKVIQTYIFSFEQK